MRGSSLDQGRRLRCSLEEAELEGRGGLQENGHELIQNGNYSQARTDPWRSHYQETELIRSKRRVLFESLCLMFKSEFKGDADKVWWRVLMGKFVHPIRWRALWKRDESSRWIVVILLRFSRRFLYLYWRAKTSWITLFCYILRVGKNLEWGCMP